MTFNYEVTTTPQVAIKDKKLWSVEDVMALTGIGRGTIQHACKSGELRARRVGDSDRGAYLILPADLDAWLESLPVAADRPRFVLTARKAKA